MLEAGYQIGGYKSRLGEKKTRAKKKNLDKIREGHYSLVNGYLYLYLYKSRDI